MAEIIPGGNVQIMDFSGPAIQLFQQPSAVKYLGLKEKLAMMELQMLEIAEEIEVRPGMPREDKKVIMIKAEAPNFQRSFGFGVSENRDEVVIKTRESDLPDKGVVKQEFPVQDVSVVHQALLAFEGEEENKHFPIQDSKSETAQEAQQNKKTLFRSENSQNAAIVDQLLSKSVAFPQCWIMSKSKNYKEFRIALKDGALHFAKPKAKDKRDVIAYPVNSFQCVVAHSQYSMHSFDNSSKKEGKLSFHYCILIISSRIKQRSVYFQSKQAAEHWHKLILSAQGFLENRLLQYTPMRNLGKGSFGNVVLTRHNQSNIKFALKSIDKALINKSFGKNNQIFCELQIMEDLCRGGCPNLVEVIETFEDETHYYIVTKLYPEGDLLTYLIKNKQRPLTEQNVKKIMLKVAIGVQGLHNRNIIHRDIKLENILVTDLTEDTGVRIADMGSAIRLDSATGKTTFMIGTPGYIAPEMLSGKPYGLAYDVWAIGALMHALLTLELPFRADNPKQRQRRVCREPFDVEANRLLQSLSQEGKDLIKGMLEKNVDERFTIF